MTLLSEERNPENEDSVVGEDDDDVVLRWFKSERERNIVRG